MHLNLAQYVVPSKCNIITEPKSHTNFYLHILMHYRKEINHDSRQLMVWGLVVHYQHSVIEHKCRGIYLTGTQEYSSLEVIFKRFNVKKFGEILQEQKDF